MQQSKNPSLEPLFEADPLASETSVQTKQPVVEPERAIDCQQTPLHREVEPWTDPVNGEQLLDDIFETIKRYIVAEDDTLRAATLWAVHTWLMDVWTVSPIAHITAPDMRCGKTLFLQVLEELVYNPLSTSNITPAAMFRTVNEQRPTLLIDEVDSFLKGDNDLRGMLNTGLYKKQAFVVRCAGDLQAPTQFSVWCAKALCGIGSLTKTLADRSIILRLRRKLPDEVTDNLRRADPALWELLRSRIARWTAAHRDALAAHVPQYIPAINDRGNDCWEPLLSIADIAGTRWAASARSAAEALHDSDEHIPTASLQLLRDVQKMLTPRTEKMFSSALLDTLKCNYPRWARFNGGNPLMPQQMARMLREFGIRARPIRIRDRAGLSGYEWSACEDAFRRFLPPDPYEISIVREAA